VSARETLHDSLDPSAFGGHPYSDRERELGYGTRFDPRFTDPYDLAEALVASRRREASLRYALRRITHARFGRGRKIAREALGE
jgi:hypothetical protein